MKILLSAFLSLLILHAAAQRKSYSSTKNGIIIYPTANGAKAVQLRVWSASIIQVTASPTDVLAEDTSFMIDAKNGAPQVFKVKEDTTAGTISLTTGRMKAVISKVTGLVEFYNVGGKVITAEKFRSFSPVQLEKSASYAITQQFNSPADEALYGLGQHAQGIMNYKGSNFTLYQNNSEVFIPLLVSSKKYGILWDNYSVTDFGDGRKFEALGSIKLFDKSDKPGQLSATYFSQKKSGKTIAQRSEKSIDYPDLQTIKNLPSAFNLDKGKATWEGALQGNMTGEYNLRVWAGGYLKIWLNGKLVLDRWRQCWNPFTAFVPVKLSKDKKTVFKMEWIPDGGESFISCIIAPPANEQQKTVYQFASEAGDNINYYLVYGKTYDDIINGYRTLTGKAPVVPKWALGFWQSRERYKTQSDVLSTVKTFRDKNIPLDNIVLDWQYWNPKEWGSQQFDVTRFSNPDSMIQVLHEQYNTKFMISVWPKFYKGIPNFDLMYRNGYLLNRNADENTKDWLGNVSTFYDVYNRDARAQFWELLKNNQYKKHIDAWWMDASEPDILSNISLQKRKELMYPNAMGSSIKYFNSYPLLNAQGIYEGQRATNDKKRVFILTRSGYAGIQRYGAAVWSGDIGATWAEMKNQIAAGVNFSMSGIPYWTLDAGGFATESRYAAGKDKEEWKELQLRWYQFAAYLPLFRAHGQFPYREPFNIGGDKEPAFKAIKAAIEMRYRLLPYLYSLAGNVYLNNGTILKGLMMEFPEDKKVETINDQFMCGPSMMVSPVYTYKARNRKVYLPAGATWYDFYTRKPYRGAQTIVAAAPVGNIPVFVRDGSIVVTGPVMQYSSEIPADTLTVTMYGKKDASFVLYEDGGEDISYETGKFTTIKINYSAAANAITFERRLGDYPEMLTSRLFKIVLVDKSSFLKPVAVKEIPYFGEKVIISL